MVLPIIISLIENCGKRWWGHITRSQRRGQVDVLRRNRKL